MHVLGERAMPPRRADPSEGPRLTTVTYAAADWVRPPEARAQASFASTPVGSAALTASLTTSDTARTSLANSHLA